MEAIQTVHALAPALMDSLSAFVALCTSLQAVFLVVGKWSPQAKAAAHWLGIAAVDLKQFGEGARKLMGKKDGAS